MINFNLVFHFTRSKHISAEDYFKDLLAEIDTSQYPYSVLPKRTIYLPVDSDDLDEIKEKGLLTINKPVPDRGEFPHYIVEELVISFPSDIENVNSDKAHLIGLFGHKAVKYQIVEEGILNV